MSIEFGPVITHVNNVSKYNAAEDFSRQLLSEYMGSKQYRSILPKLAVQLLLFVMFAVGTVIDLKVV